MFPLENSYKTTEDHKNKVDRQLDSVDRTPFFSYSIIPTSNRVGADKKTFRGKIRALIFALIVFAVIHLIGILLPEAISNSMTYLAVSLVVGILVYNIFSSKYR